MEELSHQIKKVLRILEEDYKEEIQVGVLKLIYQRYSNSLPLFENGEIEEIQITGGVRAYLDGYSDYSNPLLGEMYKAEKLVDEIVRKDE